MAPSRPAPEPEPTAAAGRPGFVLQQAPFGAMVARGELEAALHGLATLFLRLQDQPILGTEFPFPDFDAVCCEIGRRSGHELFAEPPPAPDGPHDVVLLTEAWVQGGHAEIVRDIAEWNDRKLLIVTTNLLDRKAPLLPEILAHRNVLGTIDLAGPWLGRLRAIQSLLQRPGMRRAHVLCHAHDAVAVAASGACDRPTLFFHHCDHRPCLGCFLPGAAHIDLHNLGLDRCRRVLGLDARYVCLTSREGAPPRAEGPFAYPRFKSASCGGEHKLTSLAYPLGFSDLLATVLRVRGGVHYHVGKLSDGFVEAVRTRIVQAGLDADAFIHVGHVAGFRELAAELEIDLYLPTLPQSGGKALVDAMAAGIPIFCHHNAVDRLWGSRDLIYPQAPGWATLRQLEAALLRLDEASWRAQARASRAHFDRFHGNALFARQLAEDGLHPAAPPALQPDRPDLDMRLGVLGLQGILA